MACERRQADMQTCGRQTQRGIPTDANVEREGEGERGRGRGERERRERERERERESERPRIERPVSE